ncbi:MAG: MTAP family purine nucleoside phosphorylase [Candidatus Aenigmarchaeota archaeon]|nr:MTAP family purine nucleoside phosphorylase [Candidatus Aenigmarchaeota archaeon]
MTLGIIGGTSLFDAELFEIMEEKEIDTKYGSVYYLVIDETIFIPRHGRDKNIPPHKINHKANLMALKDLNVENIIGVTSVGSLKEDIKTGSLVIPHDYINLNAPLTYYDNELVHITPGLDEDLRDSIKKAVKDVGIDALEDGIYFQSAGPRLETKAEINLIKNYADIVGMNMASEATLARELELKYANISAVDNYANGIIPDENLEYKKIVENASEGKSRENLEKALVKLMEKGK